jgi:simple sugar transport system ATP-binding protein
MTPLLEARGLSRSFGHVRALDNASFDVNAGEVVALIGDNGAGKSTMVKALTGNLEIDAGELFFEGKPVTIRSSTRRCRSRSWTLWSLPNPTRS